MSEWLDLMLGEIERKEREAREAKEEIEKRKAAEAARQKKLSRSKS